jgi:hypothetical protein
MLEIPKRMWIIFQNTYGKWEPKDVAHSVEQRNALAKHYDVIPKSGQVKWVEFEATGKEGGPLDLEE